MSARPPDAPPPSGRAHTRGRCRLPAPSASSHVHAHGGPRHSPSARLAPHLRFPENLAGVNPRPQTGMKVTKMSHHCVAHLKLTQYCVSTVTEKSKDILIKIKIHKNSFLAPIKKKQIKGSCSTSSHSPDSGTALATGPAVSRPVLHTRPPQVPSAHAKHQVTRNLHTHCGCAAPQDSQTPGAS